MTDSLATAAPAVRHDSAARPLGALALWLLATLGLHPLLVPDEGRYVGVARAMLLSGDWLVPRLDGLPFFHKPPLMYWIDAVAMRVLGVNEFAARLAPAIGAWVMGAALYLALRRWHGVRAARVALAVLATAPLFFIGGQYANHDMVVAGFISAAVFAFAAAAEDGSRRLWQLGWLACALALLAKGLIGIVLPLLAVGPWLLARRRRRAASARLAAGPGRRRTVVRRDAAALPAVLRLLRDRAALSTLHADRLQQHPAVVVLPRRAAAADAAVEPGRAALAGARLA
ncbi:MAG TPA: glycosyltransferase family 39 protein [Burkholderiaceae bacterium]